MRYKNAINDGVVENYDVVYLRTFFDDGESYAYEELVKISKLYAQTEMKLKVVIKWMKKWLKCYYLKEQD